MKFPTSNEVGIVRGCQEEAKAIYLAIVEEQMIREEEVDPKFLEVQDKGKEVRIEPMDELETFPLAKLEKDKFFSINSSLIQNQKTQQWF